MGPYYILTFARWKKVESYLLNQDPMQLCLVCLEWDEMKYISTQSVKCMEVTLKAWLIIRWNFHFQLGAKIIKRSWMFITHEIIAKSNDFLLIENIYLWAIGKWSFISKEISLNKLWFRTQNVQMLGTHFGSLA
jgi:hypothetical protein